MVDRETWSKDDRLDSILDIFKSIAKQAPKDVNLNKAAAIELLQLIDASVQHYRRQLSAQASFRNVHDELADVWRACSSDDTSLERLRGVVSRLSSTARCTLAQLSALKPEPLADEIRASLALLGNDARRHTASAPALELVNHHLRLLVSSGAVLVKGRSRGGGKRSRSSFQPIIFGIVRGTVKKPPINGRPMKLLQIELISNLAIDFHRVTGISPEESRGLQTPFGQITDAVFNWHDFGSAEPVLRRFWQLKNEEMKP
jgi:hypothetical protein